MDDKKDDIVLVEIALRYAAIPFRLRQFDNIAAATAYLKGEGSFADRAVHPLPSVILLDHQLAGCTASEALPELKKFPGCNKLPWVVFSGTLSPVKVADCYRAGADHFILKPRDASRLMLVLKTLYDCVTATPPCFVLLRSLEEYRGPSPEATALSVSP